MLSEYALACIDDYSLIFTIDSRYECMSHKVIHRSINNCHTNKAIIDNFMASAMSIDEAVQELLKLPRLVNALNTRLKDIHSHFIEHMKLYLSAVHVNSSFEIIPDADPTVKNQSFKVVARRDLDTGTRLTTLCASLARTGKLLKDGLNDFSILKEGSKLYWLLGPLAFVNHRCQMYNANFIREGTDRLYATLTKAVKSGEEITVSYGKDYFTNSSKKCFCLDCRLQETLEKIDRQFITRSSLQPYLDLQPPNVVKCERRVKKRRFLDQKRYSRPSSENSYPHCPGTTLMQNIPVRVIDHNLCRRQTSVLVEFLKCHKPIKIHLDTLLVLLDGTRLMREYLDRLFEARFASWLELVMTYPSLDSGHWLPSCITPKSFRPLCPVKLKPEWYVNRKQWADIKTTL